MNLKITFYDKEEKPGDFVNIKISYEEANEISKAVNEKYIKEKFNSIVDEEGKIHNINIENVYSFEIQK